MWKKIYINKDILEKFKNQANKAQRRNFNEVCGLVVKNKDNILELWFQKNLSKRPCRFEIGMKNLEQKKAEAKEKGIKVCGIFHSHPLSEAIPGRGDLRGSKINSLMLIYDVCDNDIKLWRICKNSKRKFAKEVPLNVI